MPEGAVYVGRPTRWGNPYKVSKTQSAAECVRLYRAMWLDYIVRGYDVHIKRDLGGKDLACFCPLDRPCHADVLIELANKYGGAGRNRNRGSGY